MAEQDDPPPQSFSDAAMPEELLRTLQTFKPKEISGAAEEFGDVQELSLETRREAIAIGKEILEKLKIVFEGIELEEFLALDDGREEFFEDIDDLTTLFEYEVDEAFKLDPAIAHDPDIALASDAVAMFAAVSSLYTKRRQEELDEAAFLSHVQQTVRQANSQNPALKDKTIDKLAKDIERGLDKIKNRTREAQNALTPESLDLRLQKDAAGVGVTPEQSQQQRQQQTQQRQQQQNEEAQIQRARAAMKQTVRQMGGSEPSATANAANQAMQRMRRGGNAGQVAELMRRRLQQQMRARAQFQQQEQNPATSAQRIRTQAQQQMQMQMQRQRQAWLVRTMQMRRNTMLAHHDEHHEHNTHGHHGHHEAHGHHDSDHGHAHSSAAIAHKPISGLRLPGMPKALHPTPGHSHPMPQTGGHGDLSKLLASTNLDALKANLTTAHESDKAVVGPRSAKDVIQQTLQPDHPNNLPQPPKKNTPNMGV